MITKRKVRFTSEELRLSIIAQFCCSYLTDLCSLKKFLYINTGILTSTMLT